MTVGGFDHETGGGGFVTDKERKTGGRDQAGMLAFRETAAANRALIGMDGLYLLGFGPRMPDAVRELMAALYPNLTLPPLPTLADRQ